MQFKRVTSKIVIITGLCVLVLYALYISKPLFNEPPGFVITDHKGILLGAAIAPDHQWRFSPGKEVPQKFISCITAFEDRRFFLHPGVDAVAIMRAALRNTVSKRKVQGGSTITMQVIRLSRKKSKRNIWNKIVESVLALQLESQYSKMGIMKLYAANAPFGGNVVGLEAAAWRYYGRESKNLSWGEMAALAVLPNAPALVHPGRNTEVLKNKRDLLLERLQKYKIIDRATCELSKSEPLPGNPVPLPALAPHLLQRFRNDVQSGKLLPGQGQTTLDAEMQLNVTNILDQHHGFLEANSIHNACALVLDVETGNTLAYVGNIYRPGNKEMESDVDVIKAPRSPGSTLKPILYAAALSDGLLLPNSLIPDIPTRIAGYTPQNYDQQYDGAVPASDALSRSLNIPAVKLLQHYKYPRFYALLKQLGFTTLQQPADHYGLSLILGGSEATMWDLAGIYAGMARTVNHSREQKGLALSKDFFAPHYISEEKEKKIDGKRINGLDATSIWFAFQAMEEVMRPGEEGVWQQFSSSQKIAWKTGTSFGFRDAWAIGVTPKYVVAVWAGNTNGEGRAGLIGVQMAAPMMFDIFKTLQRSHWFRTPQSNFDFLPVCRQSGFRANVDCPDADTVMVSKNGYRSPLCKYHQLIHLDATGRYRVTEKCESPGNMIHTSWFVLSPAMEWYYKQKNHRYKELPPFKPGCDEGVMNMELIYPMQDSRIYVPLEIDGSRGKTVFKATHRVKGAKIFWHLDDEYLGTTTDFHQMGVSPAPGQHILTLVDEFGERIRKQIVIVEGSER